MKYGKILKSAIWGFAAFAAVVVSIGPVFPAPGNKPERTFRNRYGMVVEEYADGRTSLKRKAGLENVLGQKLYALDGLYARYRYVPDQIPANAYRSRSLVVNYKSAGEGNDSLRLEIELPIDAREPVPFLVWIHGGGWHGGSPATMKNETKFFAGKGYASFRVQYRLMGKAATNEDQLRDIADAVAFIREHASEFGIDPDRYAYLGGSAGGQLTLISGIRDSLCSGIVPLYAVYDVQGFYDHLIAIGQRRAIDPLQVRFFRMKSDSLYRAVNPCDAIRPGMAPVLIVHGTGDSTAPYRFCEAFMHGMDQVGNRYESLILENYEHNFTGRGASDAYERVQLTILNFLNDNLK